MSSTYSAWKQLERRHAQRMGGVRLWRPDYGDSAPDGETETETWDCKAYANHAAVTLFQVCERKYREFTGEHRNFHLCLFARNRRSAGDLVVIPAERFKALVDCWDAAHKPAPCGRLRGVAPEQMTLEVT